MVRLPLFLRSCRLENRCLAASIEQAYETLRRGSISLKRMMPTLVAFHWLEGAFAGVAIMVVSVFKRNRTQEVQEA